MRVDGPSLCPGPTIPDAWASQKLTSLRTNRYEPMARPGRTQAANQVFDIPGGLWPGRCIGHAQMSQSGSLLPLREKVDRPKAETDEGYLSAVADVEAYPSSALRRRAPTES